MVTNPSLMGFAPQPTLGGLGSPSPLGANSLGSTGLDDGLGSLGGGMSSQLFSLPQTSPLPELSMGTNAFGAPTSSDPLAALSMAQGEAGSQDSQMQVLMGLMQKLMTLISGGGLAGLMGSKQMLTAAGDANGAADGTKAGGDGDGCNKG